MKKSEDNTEAQFGIRTYDPARMQALRHYASFALAGFLAGPRANGFASRSEIINQVWVYARDMVEREAAEAFREPEK